MPIPAEVQAAQSIDTEDLKPFNGDPRVHELVEIAVMAYMWLPPGMFSFTTGISAREWIIKAIEAFGVRCAPIPWDRFPKRFHKNKPMLHILKTAKTDEEVEQYIRDLIADQPPDPEKKTRRKRNGSPR